MGSDRFKYTQIDTNLGQIGTQEISVKLQWFSEMLRDFTKLLDLLLPFHSVILSQIYSHTLKFSVKLFATFLLNLQSKMNDFRDM